ncbi:site-2 protease family protein [Candidatus Roizmanbacteria bacterium]|nr:site-2 protease family protein [Candidatus Roizmanbacteria bacterium]
MLSYLFTNPLLFFVYLIALLVAIAVHEFSHAFAADYLGDPTPRLAGRLKLNPLVHIDGLGLLFLLFFGFGWGKPVGFDPFNLKNPRKDAAIISLAGPFSNFILASLLSIVLRLIILSELKSLNSIGYFLLAPIISLNVILGVFNLLPIHPLDGFKIVGGILSDEKAREWYQLERYGMIFLIMLIFPFGRASLLDLIIRPIVSILLGLFIPAGIGGGVI